MSDKKLNKRIERLIEENANYESSLPKESHDWETYRDVVRFNRKLISLLSALLIVTCSGIMLIEYNKKDPVMYATLYNGDAPKINLKTK